MLTNTNIACSSRVHEITRDNGGFPCLFACFREAEGGGGVDRSTVYCYPDNEKIWTILTAKVSDFFITSQDQS